MWLGILVIISSLFLNKTGDRLGIYGELSWISTCHYFEVVLCLYLRKQHGMKHPIQKDQLWLVILIWFSGGQPLEFLTCSKSGKGWVSEIYYCYYGSLPTVLSSSKVVFFLIVSKKLRIVSVKWEATLSGLYSCLKIPHFWNTDSFCSSSHPLFTSCVIWIPVLLALLRSLAFLMREQVFGVGVWWCMVGW